MTKDDDDDDDQRANMTNDDVDVDNSPSPVSGCLSIKLAAFAADPKAKDR